MSGLRYTKDHEWARLDGEVVTVGITDYAQAQLGDIVFVELPDPGKALGQGEEAAVVESVKAASEVYAPLGGEIVEVNAALQSEPALVNADPTGKGWFLKLKPTDPDAFATLMDADSYQAYLKELA